MGLDSPGNRIGSLESPNSVRGCSVFLRPNISPLGCRMERSSQREDLPGSPVSLACSRPRRAITSTASTKLDRNAISSGDLNPSGIVSSFGPKRTLDSRESTL